jgi:hypothetical protein
MNALPPYWEMPARVNCEAWFSRQRRPFNSAEAAFETRD